MGRFEAEAGLCHLVFANEDTYYLSSLLQLNLRQYLYYDLKSKGYGAVYFFSGEAGSFSVVFPDAVSRSVYEGYEEQTAGQKFKTWLLGRKESPEDPGTSVPCGDCGSLFRRVLRIMKGEKKIAFVFQIETFYSLSDCPELIEKLSQSAGSNYNRGHIFLICAPVTAGGSSRLLTDAHGVFRSPLFPEIQRIFSSYKNVQIYERLREELGQRVCFLNLLDRNSVYYMVLHFLAEQGPPMAGFFSAAEDYADFIWAWYHSSSFQKDAGPIFPVNEKRMYSVIQTSLGDREVFRRMNREVIRLRSSMDAGQSLAQWICGHYEMDSWQRLIYEENPILIRLEHLPLPQEWEKEQKLRLPALGQIRRELMKPSTLLQNPREEAYAFACVEHLRTACAREDLLTAEKSLEALRFIVCGFSGAESAKENLEDREELHRSIMQDSEHLYEITRLYQGDRDKIREYTFRLKGCIEEVHRYEKQHGLSDTDYGRMSGEKGGGEISPELHLLSVKKSEAASLWEDIRNRKLLLAQKKRLMDKCRENIRKLEMALTTLAAGSMEHLRENMENASKYVQDALVDHQVMMKNLEDASRELQFTIEEASAMEREDPVNLEDIQKELEELMEEDLSEQETEKAGWTNG